MVQDGRRSSVLREKVGVLRIFVTGATGFIGLHLCRALAARGDHVIALVRTASKGRALPPGVETFEGDLSSFAEPSTRLPPFDVMVHLAGVVAADRKDDYEAVNFRAVKDVVTCLGRQSFLPRRLLFASSLAAAGPCSHGEALTEDSPLKPVDAYGKAKARAEALLTDLPYPTTVFRPPIVFGPGDSASLTLFQAARSGVGFRVAGVPQQLSFVDVRDLVDSLLLLADDTRPGSFVYFTSHPVAFDVVELWNGLSAAVGRPVRVLPIPRAVLRTAMHASTGFSKIFRFKNQLDEKQYAQMTAPAFVCSSSKLRRDLGWAPHHGLVGCLAHAAEGYRQAGLLGAREN